MERIGRYKPVSSYFLQKMSNATMPAEIGTIGKVATKFQGLTLLS